MPSRDLRRLKVKRGDAPREEKKKRKNPILYTFSVVILVVIGISFVGGPLLSRLAGSQARILFGSYDGREIEYVRGNYFAHQYDYIANQIQQSDQQSSLESQLWQAWRYAFDQTVLHTAIMVEADRSGLWISDDMVTESLIEYGPYMVGGVFDQNRYEETPRGEKTAIFNLRREELRQSQYLTDFFVSTRVSNREEELIRRMSKRQRNFSFVYYDFDDYPEAEVVGFGEENREKFEKVKLSRITLNSKREAERVRDLALMGTTSFEELARSYSKGFYADKGGDMGWQHFHELEILFETLEPVRSLFRMEEGGISEIFQSGSSWIFFQVDSEVVSPDFGDEETLDMVKRYVLTSERGVVESYFMESAESLKERALEEGFTPASLANGLVPKDTDFFPINFGGIFEDSPVTVSDGDKLLLSAATSNEDFFTSIFALAEGEISDPILLSDKILVVTLIEEKQAEDKLSEDTIERMVVQNVDRDLQPLLVREELLSDNFQEAFYTHIVSR